MRVAFHAINGIGLGHLVRLLAIAVEIRASVPLARILFLTNARDPSMLSREGFDFVSFPPRLADPHADPDRVRRGFPGPLEEAALSAALDAFRPDLVVFDTHAPTALARHATELGARSVLVQRELRPEAQRAFFASVAPTLFDRIIIPHEAGEIDLSDEPHSLPIVVTGPIVRALDTKLPRGRRAPTVVMMAGGGGQPVAARRFLRAAADAHILTRARIPTLTTVLVAGPYGEVTADLRGIAGLEVVGSCSHLPALVARAAVVVSQAGYNSVAEIRALEKPAILVPAYRKAEDQTARAERLVRQGAAVLARPEGRSIADQLEALLLSPDALARMAEAHRTHPLVPGNRAAAEAILGPLRAGRSVKRVVLVAHEFAPRLGGMETVAHSLAVSLSAAGVDVRVYATQTLGPEVSDLPEGAVRRLYSPGIDLWGDLLVTLDALLKDAPDVIHLCNAGLAPWVPALTAAFPAVVTVHVHGNDLLAPWVHHGGDSAVYRAAQVEGLCAADAVLAVSTFSADLAARVGARTARIEIVENSVDCARFAPGAPDATLRAGLDIGPADEVVLTVSRLVPRKGHATGLRALKTLLVTRPHALYVYTGVSAQLGAELLALATELGVVDRVRALGVIAEEELPALYRLAQVFVLLSDDDPEDVEGFGVALLEAAATGLPVVATRTGGMPEAVADGSTGILVPPGDASATAEALDGLLANPSRASELGERGRERALRLFSTRSRGAQVLASWQRSLGSVRGVRPLRSFAAAIEGDPVETSALRAALRAAKSGVALVRLGQEEARFRLRRAQARRAELAKVVRKGGTVRLRAMGDGIALLAPALADCASLGHKPLVEIKLRRFVDHDFQDNALPLIRAVRLGQIVPSESIPNLLERLTMLPPDAFSKVADVRLFLSREAQGSLRVAVSAAPQVAALRRLFAARGVTVVPPAELVRYLSEAPAEGPATGMIEPTNICNLECPTCPTGKGKIPPKPQMSLERFEDVVGALVPRLVTLALWNYGEPLLHRDLPGIIRRAKAAGVRVVKVSSNAHFLERERARKLLQSGLDVLILSVDGASQETYQVFRKGGDFARVAEQVAWICAEKKRLGLTRPSIDLQFIVMRHNEHELDEIRRLSALWGIDHLRIKTVGAEDDATRHLIPTSQLLSRYRPDGTHTASHPFCTMAWDHTVVNVDGSVSPCCYLRPDMGDSFVMGNVFDTPFQEIWHGERYRAFRLAMLAGRETMPVCNKCRGGTHDLFAAIEEVAAQ